jgi:beta-galactosidase
MTLPHDWGIEGPFDQNYPGETGKLPWWGIGWYRKYFSIPEADRGKRIYLDIDGAMSYSMVWLNGHLVGGWPYGYTSYRLDLTPFIKFGDRNTLAVRLDNPQESSRWYPGGGIYRNVWLVKTGEIHVAQWGTFVTTPVVSPTSATVEVETIVQNNTEAAAPVKVCTRIFITDTNLQPIGASVAVAEPVKIRIAAGRQGFSSQVLKVTDPKLWRLTTPTQYLAVTTVTLNGRVLDEYETLFGIRTISFTVDQGFFLSGESVKLQGVCMHHDLGALGSAVNRRALQRQIEILQEMGCNAIRTSHNPPAPELLELCDRMGMVVMDEAFDCWRKEKKSNDYNLLFADWYEADLRAMIRRDRNHRCVVMWSIGNEVPDQWQPEGWKLAAHMAAIAREEDRTRSITSGFNNSQAGYNGFQKAVDLVGFN